MRDFFVKKLCELAETDSKILLITGDLGFGVFEEFQKRFPKQYLNAGVAEQNMTGLAAGLALDGRTVFTYSIGNFPTFRCLEQIRNDVCYHNANVKIVSIGGGFSYGALGFSHHAMEDLSVLRAMPELTLVAPGDDWEVMEATAALAKTPGPGYLRLDKSSAGDTHQPGEVFSLGKARVVREGRDISLIASGGILEMALKAATELAKQGVECRVLSVHTVRPLDEAAILACARETGGILTIEENIVRGGLGGAVSEICLEAGAIPEIFHRVGLREEFATVVGSQNYLRKHYGMDDVFIVKKVQELLKNKKSGFSKAEGM